MSTDSMMPSSKSRKAIEMKGYKIMSFSELLHEIDRVEKAIKSASSPFIVRDYKKYLSKLRNREQSLVKAAIRR